ncbi:MAG: chromosome segregation protein SMC, partial [Polyangiaceae bacterium]|nr:chromosome segregation protein SMC [Polyangiaceae bacterium]
EVASLDAENQRAKDRIAHLEDRLSAASREQDDVRRRIEELAHERDELTLRLEALSEDEDARISDAQSEDDALEHLKGEEAMAIGELEEHRRMVSQAREQAAGAEARLDALAARRTDGQTRMDSLTAEREHIAQELESLRAKQGALAHAVEEALSGKQVTVEERALLEEELAQLRGSRRELETTVDSLKNDLSLKKNRLRVLEDLHRRLEGVGSGARALIGKGDDSVLGLVADRIEAPEELTAAFAGLLGERLQYVVVSDAERGVALLEELKEQKRGRGHIVPQRAGVALSTTLPIEAAGIRGRLRDSLLFAAEDAKLVEALVGDALVAETSARAIEFAQANQGVTVVSIDGTVVRPDGVISGGSGDDVAAGMVEQKREMHLLGDQVASLSSDYEANADQLSTLLARITELETALDQARQAAHEGELAHVTAEKDLKSTIAELDRVEARSKTIDDELDAVRQGQEDAAIAEGEHTAQLDELSATLEQAQAQSQEAEERAASWRERVAVQSSMVTERKVRLAQVKEQTEAARLSVDRIAQLLADLELRSQRLEEETMDGARQIGEAAAQIVVGREARMEAEQPSKDAHRQLEEARGQLETVRGALGEREDQLREFRVSQTQLDEVVRENEMALQRIEMGMEHLLAGIREKFRGLDLRRVVGDYHMRTPPTDEQKARIDELQRLIDRMGPVNLDAQKEYEEAQQRYNELNDQKIDIDQALEELEKAIRQMDRESRTRFKETFEKVNQLFKETFVKNFRGGRAELRLTNPDDMLTTGVDIMAQPPGKKLGNIELMSGGEKALTAVSLIFAIFQHRPSPFCVLDEVDAPLDEANVSRYNEAIRRMTKNSQFILITHIRKTMQSVDVLYGVTMGEPGVSRLVSVRVNDEAKARSAALQEARGETVGSSSTAASGDSADGSEVDASGEELEAGAKEGAAGGSGDGEAVA